MKDFFPFSNIDMTVKLLKIIFAESLECVLNTHKNALQTNILYQYRKMFPIYRQKMGKIQLSQITQEVSGPSIFSILRCSLYNGLSRLFLC